MKLHLSSGGPRALEVTTTWWNEETPCITLVYNGTADHRTPALTAPEARQIAADLLDAANELDDQGLDIDPAQPLDEFSERRIEATIERAKQDPLLFDGLVDQYVNQAISELMAKDVVSGRMIYNPETRHLALASASSEEFRTEAIAAYRRLFAEQLDADDGGEK